MEEIGNDNIPETSPNKRKHNTVFLPTNSNIIVKAQNTGQQLVATILTKTSEASSSISGGSDGSMYKIQNIRPLAKIFHSGSDGSTSTSSTETSSSIQSAELGFMVTRPQNKFFKIVDGKPVHLNNLFSSFPSSAFATLQQVTAVLNNSQQVPTVINTSQQVPTVINTSQQVPTVINTSQQVPTVINNSQHVPVYLNTSQQVPTATTNQQVSTVLNANQQVPVYLNTSQQVPTVLNANQQVPVYLNNSQPVPTINTSQQMHAVLNNSQPVPVVHSANQQVHAVLSNSHQVPACLNNSQQVPVYLNNSPQVPVYLNNSQQIPTVLHTSQQVHAENRVVHIKPSSSNSSNSDSSELNSSKIKAKESVVLGEHSTIIPNAPQCSPGISNFVNGSLQSTKQKTLQSVGAVLDVTCRSISAEMYTAMYKSGGQGRCIKLGQEWLTPNEFERHAGAGASKKYLYSIKYLGQPLKNLVDSGKLIPYKPKLSAQMTPEKTSQITPPKTAQITLQRTAQITIPQSQNTAQITIPQIQNTAQITPKKKGRPKKTDQITPKKTPQKSPQKREQNPRTDIHFPHLGQYSSMDELKRDVCKKLNAIAADGKRVEFSIQFVEVESAKPFLGEDGEANSKHQINPKPGATAITIQTKDGRSTLLVLALNKWFQPNQLPEKEKLVRACEKQMKKPKVRGCAISGKEVCNIARVSQPH